MKNRKFLWILRRLTPIALLIIVGVSARIFFGMYISTPQMTPDSYEYVQFAKNLLTQPSLKLIINPYRAPLYPLFLSIMMTITRTQSTAEAFTRSVVAAQSLLGIATSILLYFTLRIIRLPKHAACIIAIIVAADTLILAWEHFILTESLSVFWVMGFTYVTIRTLVRQKAIIPWYMLILSLIGIFIRPALLPLPVLTYVCMLFWQKSRSAILSSALCLGCVIAIPLLHTQLNRVLWHYDGYQAVTDINLFGRILQFRLPTDSAKTNIFSGWIHQWNALGGEPHPYRLFDYFDPTVTVEMDKLKELHSFNIIIITHNAISFILHAFQNLPYTVTTISSFIAIRSLSCPQCMLQSFFQQIFRVIHSIAAVIVLLSLIIGFPKQFHRSVHRPFEEAPMTLIGLFCLVLMLTSMIATEDYSRLIVPIAPLLVASSGYYCSTWLNRKRSI